MLKPALSIKFVKTNPGNKAGVPEPTRIDPSDLAEIAMYHAPQVARIVATMYVGKKVVDTACKIAIITAQNRAF